MHGNPLLVLCAMGAAAAQMQHLQIDYQGVGPFTVSTQVETHRGKALLTASARNDSPWPVTFARFCVRSPSQKPLDCAFYLWTIVHGSARLGRPERFRAVRNVPIG